MFHKIEDLFLAVDPFIVEFIVPSPHFVPH
jgi:hypothetical protein